MQKQLRNHTRPCHTKVLRPLEDDQHGETQLEHELPEGRLCPIPQHLWEKQTTSTCRVSPTTASEPHFGRRVCLCAGHPHAVGSAQNELRPSLGAAACLPLLSALFLFLSGLLLFLFETGGYGLVLRCPPESSRVRRCKV